MKLLAAAFTSDMRMVDDSILSRKIICTEPHIRPFASHFDGAVTGSKYCLENIQKVYDIMRGRGDKRIIGPEGGNATCAVYSRDLVMVAESGGGPSYLQDYPCLLHPEQYLRLASSYYKLLTTGEPSFFEVDITYFTDYPTQYPIPEHIKLLPLISLSEEIPLPEGIV